MAHSSNSRIIVCTYAAPGDEQAELLRYTALRFGGADEVCIYNEHDVKTWFPDLNLNPRTSGCTWRPHLILNALQERAGPGDVVAFCDSTIMFERSLRPYADAMNHVLLFRGQGHPLVNASVEMYRNVPAARAILEEYCRACGDSVDDAGDRHILSLLSLKHKLPLAEPDVVTQSAPGQHRPVKLAVVTPTVGRPSLEACIRSVQAQDLPNVHHYVVVDGARHEAAVRAITEKFRGKHPVHVLVLPHNTGANNWYGHRVYGAAPWLLDAQYVAYLDDDNEVDPDHYRILLRSIVNSKARWGHSLRRIIDEQGAEVCPDNCESLGAITHTPLGPHDRLIDTSCFIMDRELAVRVSPVWNHQGRLDTVMDPDRQLTRLLLREEPRHVCVRRHSVRYRVTAQHMKEFFLRGNELQGCDFATKPDLYIFHFSPQATHRMLACLRDRTRSHALDEWQMTLWSDLGSTHNLLNGYACLGPHGVPPPPGSAVLVSMCDPAQVPWDLLAGEAGKQLWRILYTAESPNIRHAAQWDPVLLKQHFDVVLTYWKPLLDRPDIRTVFCLHNCHHLDFENPLDVAQLRHNAGQGKSVAMVLERRPHLKGRYEIPNVDGVVLECLDPLREQLVRDLRNATVYGTGWADFVARHPSIRLGHSLHRSQDTRSSVDILANHTFALIVENCDTEWYASEKIYDAWMAGAIPLYYGNLPPSLKVPEGLEQGVYVDLKKLLHGLPPDQYSAALQKHLDGASLQQVEGCTRRIREGRAAILERVGTAAFGACVRRALAMDPVTG